MSDLLSSEQQNLIQAHLRNVLKSTAFASSKRASEFLHHIVTQTLVGRTDDLRERAIGATMFGRPIDYDTANDAVVRVKASEVRRRLAEFYSRSGPSEGVQIVLPSGTYIPLFQFTSSETEGPGFAIGDRPTTSFVIQKQKRYLIASGIAAGAMLLLCLGWVLFNRLQHRPLPQSLISIVVLPLENLSDQRTQNYFADGLTEELISSLGQVSALQVVSGTSSMTYKHRGIDIPAIRRELGVNAVLEGSVQSDTSRVVVMVRLIDAQTDREIWSHRYTRDFGNLLALEGEISEAVARQVQVHVTSNESAALSSRARISDKAQDEYMQALEKIASGDLQTSCEYLKQAVADAPRFAQAHATLALNYGWLGQDGTLPAEIAFKQERREAIVAETLDDTIADSHVALGQAAADLDWDWRTEDAELQQALALNPSSAAALWADVNALERSGKFNLAIAIMKHAITLDPVSSRVYVEAALAYHLARQDNEALGQLSLANHFPHQTTAFTFPLGVIYTQKGMLPQAIEQFRLFGTHPYGLGHLGYALALSGQRTEAEQLISTLQNAERSTGIGTYEEALVYSGLRDKAQALAALERAYERHDKGMGYLKIDPCMDWLRSDAHFQDLIRRMRLT